MKHPLRPALLMLLAVAACSTSLQRQQWKVAVRADDIGVYKGFLIQYPAGGLAEDARTRLAALLDIVGTVKDVHVAVEESYAVCPSLSTSPRSITMKRRRKITHERGNISDCENGPQLLQ